MTEAEIAAAIREHPQGCTIAIRVQPGAKKTAVVGLYSDGDQTALKIAVQAPPIEGRANEALIAFFSAELKLPKSSIAVLSGELSRSKVILLRGVSPVAVRDWLKAL